MQTTPDCQSRASNVTARLLRQSTLLFVVAVACGGVLDPPRTSGESHFLRQCQGSCADGLSCISNVCTRPCIIDQSSCAELAKAAICTDQSIEPGKVAVCDQACEGASDCVGLGADFACEAGFCRAPAIMNGSGGTSGGSTGKGSGGATAGSSSGGRSAQGGAAAQGGEQGDAGAGLGGLSGGGGGSTLPAVIACPPGAESDGFDPIRHRLHGDIVEIDIAHSGGCAQHEYRLCYEGFAESYPVQVGLRLLHAANGDTCEAYIYKSLQFDLQPLAEAYARLYQTKDDIVLTSYGTYAFGNPSCENRTRAAADQVSQAVRWASLGSPVIDQPACTEDSDCSWVSTNVSCSLGCGAPVGSGSTAELEDGLAKVERETCEDFTTSCPMLFQPPCAPPRALTCALGECVP